MIDYYTVTEYSKRTGKDPGNIRKMLLQGKLVGEKLGNQWIIPKDAVYPDDHRIKSGNYKNWRRKNLVTQTNPMLMKSLKKMCSQLYDIYGDNICKIIMYGSYARGEQAPDSDVDIAVLLREGNIEEMHDKMVDVVVDYELDLAKTLSVVPIEFEHYNEWKDTLPFYKNVDKEGIILWPRT